MASNNPNATDNLKPFTGRNDPRNGRKPKGSKHISTWIQELMEDEGFEAAIQQGDKIIEYKGAPIKAIIKAQMQKAINGDTKAFDSLGRYGWSQKIEQENTGEQTLTIKHTRG